MEAALIKKYEDALEKDPNSRVFAQLGELYRKLGMTDLALKTYREGIKRHPGYNLGYLGLAFCYYDLEQYQLAYATLRPLVETSRDNLRLQKLFAQCCERLEYRDEALETWKYLLFVNPRDPEVSAKVAMLESSDNSLHEKPKNTQASSFNIDKINPSPIDDVDDWIRVDLAHQDKTEVKKVDFKKEIITQEKIVEPETQDEAPLMSLTLVDLYLAQGHSEKAREILLKMNDLNPSDERVKNRLASLEALENEVIPIEKEEDGHSRLLKIVTEKQLSISDTEDADTTLALDKFLLAIKRRAQEKSAET